MSACPKPKTVKDAKYLAYVRTLPCWCWLRRGVTEKGVWVFAGCVPADTFGSGPTEASHLDGKSRDDRVLPMCGGCHRTGSHSWHKGQRSFCRYFGVTKTQLIRDAEDLYRAWKENQ